MKTSTASITAAVTILFASTARADPDWTAGYPKTGVAPGQIIVKGALTVPAGEKTTGTVLVKIWPKDGGLVTEKSFKIDADKDGKITWGEFTLGGFDSGKEYNVRVVIPTVDKAGRETRYSPDVAIAKAK